jgi:hypothetical protein
MKMTYPTLYLTLTSIPLSIGLLLQCSVSVYIIIKVLSDSRINTFILGTKKVLLEQPTLTPSTLFII